MAPVEVFGHYFFIKSARRVETRRAHPRTIFDFDRNIIVIIIILREPTSRSVEASPTVEMQRLHITRVNSVDRFR